MHGWRVMLLVEASSAPGSIHRLLIVEQKVHEVLNVADHVCVLRTGRVSFSGPAGELKDEAKSKAVRQRGGFLQAADPVTEVRASNMAALV